MSNLILPKRYTTQKPPLGSVVDGSHPLGTAGGMVGCFLMNERGGKVVKNLINNYYGSLNSGVTWNKSIKGSSLITDGVTGTINLGDSSSLDFIKNNQSFTLVFTIKLISNKFSSERYLQKKDVTGARGYQFTRHGTDARRLKFIVTNNGGEADFIVSTSELPTSQTFYAFIVKNTGALLVNGDVVLCKNGIFSSLNVDTASGFGFSGTFLSLGSRCDAASTFSNVEFTFFYAYNRALSPSEIQQLYIAPYQMIAGRRRFIIDMAGGAEPPPPTVTPYGYLSTNKGFW